MKYRGVEYLIVPTADPTGWKWVVYLDEVNSRTGFSPTREGAVFQARRIIEKALSARPKLVE
jgi:hypothetical protein